MTTYSTSRDYARLKQALDAGQEILASKEVISNPIMRLADQKYMQTLSPQEKQLYISRLSARYREAVERFSRERR